MTPAASAAPAPDPRSGGPPRLIVSVTEIRRRLGTRMNLARAIEAAGLSLPDIGVGVPDGAEVRFDGEVESIHEGVVLTGQAAVPWTGPCRRCLRDLSGDAILDIREVYETRPTEGETWPLDHDHIDIGPLLHDTALLALPLAPLCDDDCPGPAPDVFPAVVAGSSAPASDPSAGPQDAAADPEPAKDPRWAALDDLDLS